MRLAFVLCATAQAHLLQMQLDALKSFYGATGGDSWTTKTNWDMRAVGDIQNEYGKEECQLQEAEQGTIDYFDGGWPYNVQPTQQQNRSRCYKRDPCRFDTALDDMAKWYGVGCVDPCYPPTDGDNCDFGRVTYMKLVR